MSMSEFERDEEHTGTFPGDFTLEDREFAQELHTLFRPEDEELPPFFVQTLMDAEQPRLQPLPDGFEQKMRARVFRDLKMKRQLFPHAGVRSIFAGRTPFLSLLLMLGVMLTSMLSSLTAFGSGVQYLFSGAGEQQLAMFPDKQSFLTNQSPIKVGAPQVASQGQGMMLTLQNARQRMSFSMYWASSEALPKYYTLSELYLSRQFQTGLDGPILQLNYLYSNPKMVSIQDTMPSGKIAICQFKLLDTGTQFMRLGEQYKLRNINGEASLLIDGHWVSLQQEPFWDAKSRTLLFQRDGVVFWMVDQAEEGAEDGSVLRAIAHSMYTPDLSGRTNPLEDADKASSISSGVESKKVLYLQKPSGAMMKVTPLLTSESTYPDMRGRIP